MQSKITYHQQVSYCGKPRCRKCREGSGHGPYWYAYQTVDGRTTRTYIGKTLPEGAQSPEQAAANGAGGAVSSAGGAAQPAPASPPSSTCSRRGWRNAPRKHAGPAGTIRPLR